MSSRTESACFRLTAFFKTLGDLLPAVDGDVNPAEELLPDVGGVGVYIADEVI
ncbi:MAG: hypothetical protein MJZ78_05090 [Bacteroidales bacterium]|nr:hypothetical protein [Bacteroidales bacterium]